MDTRVLEEEKSYEAAKRYVADIDGLPSLPVIMFAVMRMIDNPDADFEDLARLVEKEPSFYARIMKVANSAFYMRGQRAETLEEALGRLGMSEVRNLATTVSLMDTFSLLDTPLTHEDFWEHGMACSTAAEVISQRAPLLRLSFRRGSNPYSFYGLVHHLGVLLEGWRNPKEFSRAWGKALAGEATLCEAEREALGFDHSQVGAALVRHWNLGEKVARAIEFHHAPQDYQGDDNRSVIVTALGSQACSRLHCWPSCHHPFEEEPLYQALGLEMADAELLEKEIEIKVSQVRSIIEEI